MNEIRHLMLRRPALGPMPHASSEILTTKLRALDTLIRGDRRIPVELVEDHPEQAMPNEFTNYGGPSRRLIAQPGRVLHGTLPRGREARMVRALTYTQGMSDDS